MATHLLIHIQYSPGLWGSTTPFGGANADAHMPGRKALLRVGAPGELHVTLGRMASHMPATAAVLCYDEARVARLTDCIAASPEHDSALGQVLCTLSVSKIVSSACS